MAGTPCPRGYFSLTSSRARRDSESPGRKSSWLLVVTSESGGAVRMMITPTTAQAAMTPTDRRQLPAKLASSPNIYQTPHFKHLNPESGRVHRQIVRKFTKSGRASKSSTRRD